MLPCLFCDRRRRSWGPGDRVHPSCKRAAGKVSDIETTVAVRAPVSYSPAGGD
jgi:hypothetical protein